MRKREELPINSAARNSLWTVPILVPSRFPGGQAIVEHKMIYEEPDWNTIGPGEDIVIELYGGLITLKYDAADKRISPSRFNWVRYSSSTEAFEAFKELWGEIREIATPGEVTKYLERWYDKRRE